MNACNCLMLTVATLLVACFFAFGKDLLSKQGQVSLGEMKLLQLNYPISERLHRYPMPSGGLFSTAQDMTVFCQMILNGGILNGKRYLSEAAVKTCQETGWI